MTPPDLFADVSYAKQLDRLRDDVLELHTSCIRGLDAPYVERPGWYSPGDRVEQAALVLSAQRNKTTFPNTQTLTDNLSRLTLSDFGTDETFQSTRDHVPVLRAALSLSALTATGKKALSSGAVSALSCVLTELARVGTDGNVGGASAGSKTSEKTAFVTWRCVLALNSLIEVFSHTRKAMDLWLTTSPKRPLQVPVDWWDAHQNVFENATRQDVEALSPTLLNNLSEPGNLNEDELKQLVTRLKTCAQAMTTVEFRPALNKVDDYSGTDHKDHAQHLLSRCQSLLEEILDRSRPFLQGVVDHELASSLFHENRVPDVAELLFAADALATIQLDDDALIDSVLEKVLPLVTNNGRVPSHRPFDTFEKGYVLHVAASEIVIALSRLMVRHHREVPLDVFQKLWRHLLETYVPEYRGWRHERSKARDECQWWCSALADEALTNLNRALTQTINSVILRNFSVREGKDLRIGVKDLFYPDLGLQCLGLRKGRKSLSETVLALKGHASGAPNKSNLASAILYGPPGTGKTSIAEAIAKDSKTKLVEITPSDIVLGGVEQVETRARTVFEGLSMLSKVVILFDEFDSVLWHRDPTRDPTTIFQFLTPGMLPKLKNLHDRALSQNVAYILCTNFVSQLDAAAIREGRFDVKIGVFPPDFISRYGRLFSQLLETRGTIDANQMSRAEEVVALTDELPMTPLAKRGYFTKGSTEQGTYFNYILNGTPRPSYPEVRKNAWKSSELAARLSNLDADGQAALNAEWKEGALVAFLDKLGKENPKFSDFKAAVAHAQVSRFMEMKSEEIEKLLLRPVQNA